MTRIVAGTAKGLRLAVPTGAGTRPTADRAREALFSSLEAHRGTLVGAAMLDLYAGSGAVGLEALSRGADRVLFVESDPRALRTLRANVATVGLAGAAVMPVRVSAWLASAPPGVDPDGPGVDSEDEDGQDLTYDVAFLDPPYAEPADRLREVVAALATGTRLAPGALVVVERSSRDEPWSWPQRIAAVQQRRYGEATLWYGRAADPGAAV